MEFKEEPLIIKFMKITLVLNLIKAFDNYINSQINNKGITMSLIKAFDDYINSQIVKRE